MRVNYLSTQFDNGQADNLVKELYEKDGKAIALPGELDFNFNIKTDSLVLYLFKIPSVHE